MAEGGAAGAQGRLGLGAGQARPEPRGQRGRVELDRAQPREVERDDGVVPAADRLEPADDAGAAAVGDHRDAVRGAGAEHRLDGRGVGAAAGPRRARARAARSAAGPGPGSCGRRRGAAGPRRPSSDLAGGRARRPPGPDAARAARPARGRRARPRRRARRRAPRAGRPRPAAAARGAGRGRPTPTTSSPRSARPPPVAAVSRPAAPRSGCRPVARRIIGEPKRERPRSRWSRAIVTSVSPFSGFEPDLGACALQEALERRPLQHLLEDVALASAARRRSGSRRGRRGRPWSRAPGSSCAPPGLPR